MLLLLMERLARAAAPALLTPVTAPLVAALKVIAPAVPSPMLLLFRLIVVTTAPVFDTPVKPPLVAVEVFPRTILLLMLRTPGLDEFTRPTSVLEEAAPVMALVTRLLFMLIVAVLRAPIP